MENDIAQQRLEADRSELTRGAEKIPDDALWQARDLLLDQNPNVTVAWCKGHSGVRGNEDADTLASSRLTGAGSRLLG